MASTQPPAALSFPRPIFAAVSPHPFLHAHLTTAPPSKPSHALRANGRTAHDFRTPSIHTGSLTHSNGSAVVRLGNTSVVCGVRAEILKEEDVSGTAEYADAEQQRDGDDADGDDMEELDSLRLLVPNVELSTGSTPQHIPGSAPSAFAQTLVTRLRALLLSTRLVRAADLRILHAPLDTAEQDSDGAAQNQLKAYWTLYIDTFFISLDGNAFDAAWLAILAALQDTLLPRAFWDDDLEMVLCSDVPGEARRLQLRGLPVASTFAVFEGADKGADAGGDAEQQGPGSWVLSDPDAFEESVCSESVCVVVDCGTAAKGKGKGKGAVVRRMEKNGGGVVGREEMKGLVKRAVERWGVVEAVLGGNA
ncbi:ribosomal protein S5 domain 2-type protein [Massariosphaeria phaeospora]|uniref:Ribosomal RNA-processing protein 43 n=1 Tax=Massariosphaeria phaeospora TaxID=100035 RepID=A0A7C8MA81_9PLEO|nr:ribosomal protein S5 domain 2-type protein [Massariosphaeria phaeospora]